MVTKQESPQKAEKTMNRFARLIGINVGDHIEKKKELSYLSWAWAWAEFKKIFPDSYYTIYENADGWNYHHDGKTCWVKTGVTLVDGEFQLEHVEYLPIMDYSNKSIRLDNVTSMDINKAIQRSLTKAIARHGIGLYVYAGEDLPEETEEEKAARLAAEKQEKEEIQKLREEIDAIVKRVTADFDTKTKNKFAEVKIEPIIGQKNYKTCVDKLKLAALLRALKAAKAA